MATSRHLLAHQHHVTRDPHAQRTPGQQDAQLEPILGIWQLTGDLSGEETFERMHGGFFVHGRFDRMIDGKQHDGVIILGYDRDRSAFLSRHFDNLGYAREYTVTIDGARWRFTGPWERATFELGDGTYVATWEMSNDSRIWKPLCRYNATRVSCGR